MKQILAFLLALCLGCACCFAGVAEENAASAMPSMWTEGQSHQIEKKDVPLYIGSPEHLWPEDFPVYLVDGAEDLAYLDLRDFVIVLESFLAKKTGGEEGSIITVMVDEENQTVSYIRNTGSLIAFSFAEKQIAWTDYLAFGQAEDGLYMNMLRGFKTADSEGNPRFLQVGNTRDRHGRAVVLDLGAYGIPMLAQDGLYLIPAQTLSAFCLGMEGLSLYYNQKSLILTTSQEFDSSLLALSTVSSIMDKMKEIQDSDLSEEEKQAKIMELAIEAQKEAKPTLFNLYSEGPKGERSQAMADYGWRELCLELDSFYGLKDLHDVDSFLRYMTETGLLPALMSKNPEEADKAVWDLTMKWLDDGHSRFYSRSYLSATSPDETDPGFSKSARQALQLKLLGLRTGYPEAAPGYYETGDTAFLTLDTFNYNAGVDHYAVQEGDPLPVDTFGQVINAHRQITRENSPIKNVVLDLSQNIGGANAAALYLISWMLGDAQMSVKDMFSGAESTASYRADVNLDGVFDEQDTLAGRGLNLYCLTSPVSFSCGNLVPWAFKAEGSVKLLGSVTGGGSCAVWTMITAWGTSMAISGPTRLSFLKNGAYYDVDQGVQPDYVIASFDHYYDREGLAEFIKGIY